uniref:Uncharacterized protein n=1 Tax=Thermogemmatispora argillosa TaxID=2045280 RepID=A0A455T0X6_9CHLR|nr:hypothetical protein KTA_12180 [Thermogemmatispora argillosa]
MNGETEPAQKEELSLSYGRWLYMDSALLIGAQLVAAIYRVFWVVFGALVLQLLLLQHCERLGQRAESQGQARLAMWREQLGPMIGVMVVEMAIGGLVALSPGTWSIGASFWVLLWLWPLPLSFFLVEGVEALALGGVVSLGWTSLALMGVASWQPLLPLCFLAEGVVALVAWGLARVLMAWLYEVAPDEGGGPVQRGDGGDGEAEAERLVLVGGPCLVWLLGALLWGDWPPAGPHLPRWLWVGELAPVGAFVIGLLVLELRVGWRLVPELVRLSRWVLPRWWRWWRATRGGARGVGSLLLWLLAVVVGVGGSLWLEQELLWRLSLGVLLVGLGALGARLLVWFSCDERRARLWGSLSRVWIWVMVLGSGGFFALAMIQIWFDLWPAGVGLALPGGGWQVVMSVLLLRLAFWCLLGASGRSGGWSGAGVRKESLA